MSDEGVLTYIFPNSGIVVPNRIFVGGIPYGVSLTMGVPFCHTKTKYIDISFIFFSFD
jgi:ABC-type nitrate/sulfonate/bicarbonate transport system substrate-binding protein